METVVAVKRIPKDSESARASTAPDLQITRTSSGASLLFYANPTFLSSDEALEREEAFACDLKRSNGYSEIPVTPRIHRT